MDIFALGLGIAMIAIGFHLNNMVRQDKDNLGFVMLTSMWGIIIFVLILGVYLITLGMFT